MTCARCGRKVTAETSVYSPHRKLWYCFPARWESCDKLYRKKQAA